MTFELNARSNFKCLGADCPRTCCRGWDQIEVDKQTIERWQATDESDRQYLMSQLRERDGTWVMRSDDEKLCSAYNENGLCNIQMKYGHEYLSSVCRSFPRLNFENDYKAYSSASFACPAVVDVALFSDSSPLISECEQREHTDKADAGDKLLHMMDTVIEDILNKSNYSLGTALFLISDLFTKLIAMSNSGELSENIILEIQGSTETFLSDISAAVKKGRLQPNPVTSGSFWKSVYELCESRGIEQSYLYKKPIRLRKEIEQCDDSFASFSRIYAIVKKLRKKANKQLKQQYASILRKYIRILFINKGFPLAPKHPLDLVLVDTMVNACVLQLLIWIEVDKNEKLTDRFLKDCIVEVDRKCVLYDGIIKGLKENPHMLQIEKYCNSFLDLY